LPKFSPSKEEVDKSSIITELEGKFVDLDRL
jgi:hypothetical protein